MYVNSSVRQNHNIEHVNYVCEGILIERARELMNEFGNLVVCGGGVI